MARGAESKEKIFQKMLEVFSGSFMADAKTLRIPMEENGEVVEIKVALTAAKDTLGGSVVEDEANVSAPQPAVQFSRAEIEEMINALGDRVKY